MAVQDPHHMSDLKVRPAHVVRYLSIVRRSLAVLVSLALLIARPIAQQPQTPVFRAGVDLVTVDVVVLNKQGQLVTDLKPDDFTVTAGKRPRRIVSAEYIPIKVERPASEGSVVVDLPPAATTNVKPPTGRTFVFVIDAEEIRAGEGRGAINGVGDYLKKLDSNDRVGLVVLPSGTPRVDVTVSRKPIREALRNVAGLSDRYRSCDMTPGEASNIARGDPDASAAYSQRVAAMSCPPSMLQTAGATDIRQIAERTLDLYRRQAASLFDSLRALAAAMGKIDGPKAIVLVAENVYTDRQTSDALARFADAAERARVALYALHLDMPFAEASTTGGSTILTRKLDDEIGFDSMGELAVAARGTALRSVGGNVTKVLEQIDNELSGYYLLSFERSADDRDGQRVGIDVKTTRPGLDVRSRREFTPGQPPRPEPVRTATPAELKSTMGELLRWPVPVPEVNIALDTIPMPVDGDASRVRTIAVAELSLSGAAPAAIGFEAIDDAGKVVADAFDTQPALQPTPDGRSLYPFALAVSAGHYSLKFGVVTADGKRGSVDHEFDVPEWRSGTVRVSDIMLGDAASGTFRPIAVVAPGANAVAVRVEAQADASAALAGNLRMSITRAGGTAPVVNEELTLNNANPLKRTAIRVVPIAAWPAGDYIVRISFEPLSGAKIERMKMFHKN